jgi:hypothetical protein
VALDNFSPRPYVQSRDYLAVLLRLGFTHAPPAGGAADRPPGRYPGEQFYCTDSGRPLWWDGRGAWRTAAGESV